MDDIDPRTSRETLAPLPKRLHHFAVVIRDQETNRRFFEDVLGIPLVATWCERAFNPEAGHEIDYCHTFYALEDGGALAFFQYADPAVYERLKPTNLPVGQHIAFKVVKRTYDDFVARLETAGIPCRQVDHGYCQSMYVMSPDGLRVEFTVDSDDAEEIAAIRRADAHTELARWLGGDHRINNDLRHRHA
jgi:glyoxylase I family protein